MQKKIDLLLCFLAADGSLNDLKRKVLEFGGAFHVVEELCSESFDEILGEDFLANWRGTLDEETENDIMTHGAVLYLRSDDPYAAPLETAVEALSTIGYLLSQGAIAAKVEGSDMVYSSDLWIKIAEEAVELDLRGQRKDLLNLCSFALVRRGIEGDFCYETIGYHFLGIPELHFSFDSTDHAEVLMQTEKIAWILFDQGRKSVEERYDCEWDEDFYHTESDVRYNPYGILSFFAID